MTWRDNSDNETGFVVEYGLSEEGLTNSRSVGPDHEEYTVSGLSADTTYYFCICAENDDGVSEMSDVISVTTLSDGGGDSVPAAPSGLSATAISSSSIELAWTDSSDNETGFRILRSLSSSSGFTQIATVGENVEAYTNTMLTASTTFYYRVYAYNGAGDSASYTADSATTPASGGSVPESPTGLNATTQSSSSISLTWNDNSDDETGFRILRSLSSSSGFTQIATVGTNVESYTNTSLDPSTTYYYRVYAYNGYGDSASYTADSATTQAAGSVPASPSGLSATALSASSIALTWNDNSSNETGFRIYRSLSSSSGYSQIDTVSSNIETYTDTDLDADETYYYRVYAYNSYGNSGYTSSNATTYLFSENFDTYFLDRWYVTGSFLSHYNTDVFWTGPGALGTVGCFRLDGGYLNSMTDGEYCYTWVDNTGVQPTYVQVYIAALYDDYYGGEFLLVGDGISLWVFFDNYGGIYLTCNGSDNYVRSYSTGNWYRLEFKDINWSAKTFDFYVNGTQYEYDVSFANTSATKAQQIWIWNDQSSCDFWYDEILIR